jgi:hypothetical protein
MMLYPGAKLGPTGTFRQFLDAPHFQVGDVT